MHLVTNFTVAWPSWESIKENLLSYNAKLAGANKLSIVVKLLALLILIFAFKIVFSLVFTMVMNLLIAAIILGVIYLLYAEYIQKGSITAGGRTII